MDDKAPPIKKPIKKIDANSIKLMVAGDLLYARVADRNLSQVFKRYETILEVFANMELQERLINYKFFVGLILTSHAKKLQDKEKRKELFDLKNQLFFNVANNRNIKGKIAFKYLISKNFRVVKFCEKCSSQNNHADDSKHEWKFCKDCVVDRKFYNVLSMHHKFESGSSTLYLSNDLVKDLKSVKVTSKGKLEDFKEEAKYQKYHFNVKNLDIFDLDSVLIAHKKLMSV